MKAITYKNTLTTLPNWVKDLHEKEPRGIAYETSSHFVHFYCRDYGWWVLSPGITVVQKKSDSLNDWVKRTFGAKNILNMSTRVGESVKGVWRPGLYFDDEIQQALSVTTPGKHESLVSIGLLLESLEIIFRYIEPSPNGMLTYSHKTRELLIIACTEVENQLAQYMKLATARPINKKFFTTQDYVRLSDPLHLSDFVLSSKAYPHIGTIHPFGGWKGEGATSSIPWYEAYNHTKHDRQLNFDKATLKSCIDAVCANIVLFCVRYSPYALVRENGNAQSLFGQLFNIEMKNCDPTKFYVPRIDISVNTRTDLICYNSYQKKDNCPWNISPLIL